MKTYELVFLDADETLLDFRKAERYALSESFGHFGVESGEPVVQAYEEINTAIWKRLEKGELDQERLKVERFRLLFEALHCRSIQWLSALCTWNGSAGVRSSYLMPKTSAYTWQKNTGWRWLPTGSRKFSDPG